MNNAVKRWATIGRPARTSPELSSVIAGVPTPSNAFWDKASCFVTCSFGLATTLALLAGVRRPCRLRKGWQPAEKLGSDIPVSVDTDDGNALEATL